MREITVNCVSKSFGEQRVLSQVSATFAPGQITGIVGRNGSGKTVLLKCIIGLMRPDSGEIRVGETRVGKDADFAPNVGFIIETPGFLLSRSGFQNLKYLSLISGRADDAAIRSAIARVGLNPAERKRVGKYSLGMRQRLGIAQAIMEDNDVLIFDEPMNSLDAACVADMRTLLIELAQSGKTLIVTSHNHEDIDSLCSRVYAMEDGVLRETDQGQTSAS